MTTLSTLDNLKAQMDALKAQMDTVKAQEKELKDQLAQEEAAAQKRLFDQLGDIIAPAIENALKTLNATLPEAGIDLRLGREDGKLTVEVFTRKRVGAPRASTPSNGGSDKSPCRDSFSARDAGVSKYLIQAEDGAIREFSTLTGLLTALGVVNYGADGSGDSASRAVVKWVRSEDQRVPNVYTLIQGAKIPLKVVIDKQITEQS